MCAFSSLSFPFRCHGTELGEGRGRKGEWWVVERRERNEQEGERYR
jgi:hypothetical protein